jgi:hypothetical protein
MILLNIFLVMKEDSNVIFYILSFFLIIFPFESSTLCHRCGRIYHYVAAPTVHVSSKENNLIKLRRYQENKYLFSLVSSMEGMSSSQLVKMMAGVNLNDQAQAAAAIQALNAAGGGDTTTAAIYRNIVDTTTQAIMTTR